MWAKNAFLNASSQTRRLNTTPAAPPEVHAELSVYIEFKSNLAEPEQRVQAQRSVCRRALRNGFLSTAKSHWKSLLFERSEF